MSRKKLVSKKPTSPKASLGNLDGPSTVSSDTGATIQTPPQLRKGDRINFQTMLRAAENNELALVSAIRKSDGAAVALCCAMQVNKDGTITPVPFAVMVEGNPFELFEDPTADAAPAKPETPEQLVEREEAMAAALDSRDAEDTDDE